MMDRIAGAAIYIVGGGLGALLGALMAKTAPPTLSGAWVIAGGVLIGLVAAAMAAPVGKRIEGASEEQRQTNKLPVRLASIAFLVSLAGAVIAVIFSPIVGGVIVAAGIIAGFVVFLMSLLP